MDITEGIWCPQEEKKGVRRLQVIATLNSQLSHSPHTQNSIPSKTAVQTLIFSCLLLRSRKRFEAKWVVVFYQKNLHKNGHLWCVVRWRWSFLVLSVHGSKKCMESLGQLGEIYGSFDALQPSTIDIYNSFIIHRYVLFTIN